VMQMLLRSKRFWLAVASAIAVASRDYLPLSEQQIQDIVLVVAAWIVGDSLRSTDKTMLQGPNYYVR